MTFPSGFCSPECNQIFQEFQILALHMQLCKSKLSFKPLAIIIVTAINKQPKQ